MASTIRVRWLYEACYEIEMANGQHILTDPDLRIHKLPGFSEEMIERVDYLLLTHPHFDHTSDIGWICEKFHPKFMVGELAAMPICRFFNLSFADIYPVGNGDVMDFGDAKFEFLRGRHTKIQDPERGRPKATLQTTIRNFGIEGHGECDQFGWIENYQFLITTNDNFRIMMVSGLSENLELYRAAERFRPNLLIRQACMPTPGDYADEIIRYRAPLVLPHHHEKIERRWHTDFSESEKSVRAELASRGSAIEFHFPEQFRWYEISLGLR